MTEYADLFNAGIEAAVEHLTNKAKAIRKGHDSPSTHIADVIARLFEAEATEILLLRRKD